MTAWRERLGKVGIWSMELRFGDGGEIAEAAAELDELGYGAIWIPGGIGGDVPADVERLLAAAPRAIIATGILNIWKHEAAEIAAWWKGLSPDRQARLMLGLGVSHGPLIGEAWKKPLAATRDYVAALVGQGVPADALCLAALGPKMLELARDCTTGAHPYLVTPEHTATARAILGPDKLLAPEQGVVLESDPVRARELAREALVHYRRLPNYMNSWLRLGFTQAEIDVVDDRLIDALFAWGDCHAIAKRVQAHHDAGADHVCIQVVTGGGGLAAVRPQWRELAAALLEAR
ncbi:MAG: LLM class F420-dependent oxidoreductase [Novosphingobium sp.]